MNNLFKLTLSLCLVLAFSSAYAQKFVSKGSLIGGGGFSFVTSTTTEDFGTSTYETKSTGISFNPGAMFFVIDDLGVGASMSINSNKSSQEGGFESKSSSFLFGPMVRYYFAKGPFAEGSFAIGSGSSSSTSGGFSSESKFGVSSFDAGLGYSTRITETIFVEPFVGYRVTAQADADSDAVDSSSGIFISIGFTMLLISK